MREPWFSAPITVPRWLVIGACIHIALPAVLGVHLIVTWLS